MKFNGIKIKIGDGGNERQAAVRQWKGREREREREREGETKEKRRNWPRNGD